MTRPRTLPHRRRPAPLSQPADGRISVVLGPTNTGKTHLAVERMLGHSSGVIGLPLRLLAREVYDRIVARRGARAVALVTGEEKIIPPHPAYHVATVEAMPLAVGAAFVAVDEIQLCAHPERGHVFTDRLLRARGREETMFLGAATMAPLLRRLLPDADFASRPRFSKLTHAGVCRLSRLPRRSAVVAFSANDVYAVAEMIRRHKGGAAVVMGALSPRSRNAQVALYQNGDVDYLVATDAIGMGLNLNVDHVAFAGLSKFDGHARRPLSTPELAQIAGRAGRHVHDGSFGTLGAGDGRPPGQIEASVAEDIEAHRFEAIKTLFWRNADLDFTSPQALIHGLVAPVPWDGFTRAGEAEDLRVLRALSRQPEIAALTRGPAATRQLWEVCRVPDFRKIMAEAHGRLLGQIFAFLMSDAGVVPADWLAREVDRLDRVDGDIDTLAARIAHVRTWTFVANRADWLADPSHWRGRTRAIEDKLSDALHARLTQRFVDRRATVLMRRLGTRDNLFSAVKADGDVMVEDEFIGSLQGLRFIADDRSRGSGGRLLRHAAARALGAEIERRVGDLERAEDAAFLLRAPDGPGRAQIWWDSAPLAKVVAGPDILSPRVRLKANSLLPGVLQARVRARLETWLAATVHHRVVPLMDLRAALDDDAAALSGPARGLAFQMVERLGWVDRAQVAPLLRALTKPQRARLRRLGVRFGALSVYLPAMLKPPAARRAQMLWATFAGIGALEPLAFARRLSLAVKDRMPTGYYASAGFRVIDGRAVRIDRLERLAGAVRKLSGAEGFAAGDRLEAVVGCRGKDFAAVMDLLGFERRDGRPGLWFVGRRRRTRRTRPARDHPWPGGGTAFAELAALKIQRPGP